MQRNSEFKILIMLQHIGAKQRIKKDQTNQSDRDNDPYHFQTPQSRNIDTDSLAKELKQVIEGEVRFDNSSRALYSTDSSNYRQIPIGIVVPKNENDIIKAISLCRKY